LNFLLLATPKVFIESKGPHQYFQFDEIYSLNCKVQGYPVPVAHWEFKKCDTPSTCQHSVKVTRLLQPVAYIVFTYNILCQKKSRNFNPFIQVSETSRKDLKSGFISTIEFKATQHGSYTCFASNQIGEAFDVKNVTIVGMFKDY